jgi:hypothetical protein
MDYGLNHVDLIFGITFSIYLQLRLRLISEIIRDILEEKKIAEVKYLFHYHLPCT